MLISTLNASVPAMHACVVENPLHAGDVIAYQRQLPTGPAPAAAPCLLIVQQVEEAVQLQVAFELICHLLLLLSSVPMRSCSYWSSQYAQTLDMCVHFTTGWHVEVSRYR